MYDHTPISYCVYVIQDARGAVKIGITVNVSARLSELQVGNPHELTVAYRLLVDNRALAQEIESILHRRYAADALRGEWFSTNVYRLIEDIEFAVVVGKAIRKFSKEQVVVKGVQDDFSGSWLIELAEQVQAEIRQETSL